MAPLKFNFGGTPEYLSVSFNTRSKRVVDAAAQKMEGLMQRLADRIVATKLHGQMVNFQSGKLAGSVRPLPVEVLGTKIIGQVGVGAEFNPEAWYAEPLISGTGGPYFIRPVGKKALKIQFGDGTKFAYWVLRKPMPGRDFMGTTLEEMREEIVRELSEVVFGVVE